MSAAFHGDVAKDLSISKIEFGNESSLCVTPGRGHVDRQTTFCFESPKAEILREELGGISCPDVGENENKYCVLS